MPLGLKRALAALMVLLALAGCGRVRQTDPLPLEERISNAGEVIASIRRGLKNHARTITVTFSYGSDIFRELGGAIDAWMEAALAETGEPDEGDYLRYQYGGYTYASSYVENDGRLTYTVKLTPDYYCRLSQEERASEAAGALLTGFGFRAWTSDYDRICAIYDWLCQNVRYDKVHHKNPYYHLGSTAYAALVLKNATCQGYCVSLYRLLREAGISCRIVTGTASDGEGAELHAWVIARLDGAWYNLDPTWDAGGSEYRFFLAGERDFADHVPGARFTTEQFRSAHPMAANMYELSA